MVKFYLRKVKNEEMSIDEVPNLWRKKVVAELEKESEQ